MNETSDKLVDLNTSACLNHCNSGYYNMVNNKYICID